jgi:hypothetical protein
MSVALAVILECGPIPDGVVPREEHCGGQNVVRYLGTLADAASGSACHPLTPTWSFRRSTGRGPCEPPGGGSLTRPRSGVGVPLDGRPVTDPAYLAAVDVARAGRMKAEAIPLTAACRVDVGRDFVGPLFRPQPQATK